MSTTVAGGVSTTDVDYRDPEVRLRALFDAGSLRLLAPRDDSGVCYARGEIDGTPAIAYATDATRPAVGARKGPFLYKKR